jgi:hypothetical protein
MAKHSNPGVFDVSKPGKSAPSPSSRPIITGHKPITTDPTLRSGSTLSRSSSVPIRFDDEHHDEENKVEVKSHSEPQLAPSNDSLQFTEQETPLATSNPSSPADSNPQEVENAGLSAILATNKADDPVGLANTSQEHEKKEDNLGNAMAPSYSAVDSLMDEEKSHSYKETHEQENQNVGHDSEVLHVPQITDAIKKPKRGKGNMKVVLAAILVLLIAGYLAADAGAFGGSIKMPFHVFKQKTAETTPAVAPNPAPPKTPAVVAPAVPAGMAAFSDPSVPLSFNYLTAWGKPTITTEDGTTSRTASPKSDGIYAYKITFDTDKDIELTATSNKYLPVRKTTTYYDYLQWCIGTNDTKFYQQTLRYTTANGTDTPTTITCDQGPLDGAVKIDEATIMQPNVKDASGKTVLGDIYIKNLTDKNFSVVHVKDATMKNGDDIKNLLSGLKGLSK